MLAAEAEGLLEIHLSIEEDEKARFVENWLRIYDSEAESGDLIADTWSKIRHEIVEHAFDKILMPRAIEWLKDDLKQASEDAICQRAQAMLEQVSAISTDYGDV
jgi:transcriptional accessory protein Tex/SPT6